MKQSLRTVLKPALLIGLAGWLALPAPLFGRKEPKRSKEIKYINPVVPDVELPGYQGERYQASVPDTLDLADRARLAVNGLTGPTNREADYELYWALVLGNNPPYMYNDFNDHVQIKFYEALPLVRLASGSHQDLHVEQRLMEVLVQMQGPDGLLYYPRVGRPWATKGFPASQFSSFPEGDHYTEPYANVKLPHFCGQFTAFESSHI